ncbi:hypothetical protein HYU07_06800 [Candidatus Woesearchaeota archaeon]|nr:hypothetical protein [Candidatus Woesearchaeota archaeon]
MKLKTSKTEINHLWKAWLAISVAFAIVLGGGFSVSLFSFKFLLNIIFAAFTVGIGFLLHELAHKLTAQHFGYWSEFRANFQMLFLMIAMSFLGFVFAAPGATMIAGRVEKNKYGMISAAGPLVNIVLALFFLGLSFTSPYPPITLFALYGLLINSWLALFNMIPFGILDGAKVIRWNVIAYSLIVIASLALVVVGNALIKNVAMLG